MKRVVITGLGTVNPLGNNKDEFFEGLKQGKNGIDIVKSFDITQFSSHIAGEVQNFDPFKYMDKKEVRRFPKFVQYAVAAATDTLQDSGLDLKKLSNEVGVIIGSGIGGLDVMEEQVKNLIEKGPDKVSPFTVPLMIADMAAGQVGIALGAKGPNSCLVTACASGSHSIGHASDLIRMGRAKAMFAGGTEAVCTPLGFAGFCAAKALSTRNDDPKHASRPFDKKRDGFVMGEGAGMVLIEELEHAKNRGAKIYAEIIGFGQSGDAYHITAPAPEGEGGARAMSEALRDANINRDDIDYINAHGTSTLLNDKFETMAIKKVFGSRAKEIPISSIKSMTGHLLGAAGAVEAIASIFAIREGIIPPTINYEVPDEDCDLDYVPNVPREKEINIAMSNSFGFGGHNAVLIFKKYQ